MKIALRWRINYRGTLIGLDTAALIKDIVTSHAGHLVTVLLTVTPQVHTPELNPPAAGTTNVLEMLLVNVNPLF